MLQVKCSEAFPSFPNLKSDHLKMPGGTLKNKTNQFQDVSSLILMSSPCCRSTQKKKDKAEQMLVPRNKTAGLTFQTVSDTVCHHSFKRRSCLQEEISNSRQAILESPLAHFELLICIRRRPSFPHQQKITTSKAFARTI